jgi:CRP-like cAMP-binding protein
MATEADNENSDPIVPSQGNPLLRNDLRLLSSFPVFGNLPADAHKLLERRCHWRSAFAGERLIERGQKTNEVFLLLSGEAHVLNFSTSGRVVDYTSLKSGDFFGELAAVDGLPRSATVVTRTECRLAVLPASVFMELIDNYPQLNHFVLKRLARVVREGTDRITDLSLLSAEQRVCLELLRLARPDPALLKSFAIFPVPTQNMIANSVGVSRETVARIFGRLTRRKVIERKSRTLYILDRDKLEEMAMTGVDVPGDT